MPDDDELFEPDPDLPLLEVTITVHRDELFRAVTRVGPTVVLETSASTLPEVLDAIGRHLRAAVT